MKELRAIDCATGADYVALGRQQERRAIAGRLRAAILACGVHPTVERWARDMSAVLAELDKGPTR